MGITVLSAVIQAFTILGILLLSFIHNLLRHEGPKKASY